MGARVRGTEYGVTGYGRQSYTVEVSLAAPRPSTASYNTDSCQETRPTQRSSMAGVYVVSLGNCKNKLANLVRIQKLENCFYILKVYLFLFTRLRGVKSRLIEKSKISRA